MLYCLFFVAAVEIALFYYFFVDCKKSHDKVDKR